MDQPSGWQTERRILTPTVARQELSEKRLLYVLRDTDGAADAKIICEYGWHRPAGRRAVYLMSERMYERIAGEVLEDTGEDLNIAPRYFDAPVVDIAIPVFAGRPAGAWRIAL